ncbi:MAG TPA: sulfite exporter TauE/SafE family protein [Cellvibrio sp.]|nr:sulfite exporter TauE/SafE family protein [Cellvibrio sp.]
MIDLSILLSLFTLGLVSSTHCIGMCGGIMGALTMAIPAEAKAKRGFILLAYNFGRIASYALMGLLAGFFAEQIAGLGGLTILRVFAGLLLIAMGLYLADWWRGLTKLETLGRYLWVYLQPLGKHLMPVNNVPKALFLGALWGWLPCGLVYAALAMAMTQPVPIMAASAMLAFGLGTLPAVLAAGYAAQQLTRILQQRQVRIGLALIIIIFGVWTIWGGLGHSPQHQHQHQHQQHQEPQHTQQSVDGVGHTAVDLDHSQMDHSPMRPLSAGDSSVKSMEEPVLERQRTEGDIKMEENKRSSASSLVTDESAEHMHHH